MGKGVYAITLQLNNLRITNCLLFDIYDYIRDYMTEKLMRFQGKKKDLSSLTNQIAQKLQGEGYKVQSANGQDGMVIQATKAGIARDIISADRAFTIHIAGNPNDFTIRIGIGKFIQNLGVTAAETLLISPLFLAVDVPEMLWTKHVENGIAKDITDIVGQPNAAAPKGAPSGQTRKQK